MLRPSTSHRIRHEAGEVWPDGTRDESSGQQCVECPGTACGPQATKGTLARSLAWPCPGAEATRSPGANSGAQIHGSAVSSEPDDAPEAAAPFEPGPGMMIDSALNVGRSAMSAAY